MEARDYVTKSAYILAHLKTFDNSHPLSHMSSVLAIFSVSLMTLGCTILLHVALEPVKSLRATTVVR